MLNASKIKEQLLLLKISIGISFFLFADPRTKHNAIGISLFYLADPRPRTKVRFQIPWLSAIMAAYLPSRIILYTYNEQSIQLRPNVGFFKANDSCHHFKFSSGLSEYETVPLLIALPEHAVSSYLLRPVGRVHLCYIIQFNLVWY